jgi:hypothetical protein
VADFQTQSNSPTDFPGMLSAGYFHPFSSRVAASVVGIDNDREDQPTSCSSRAKLDKNWILLKQRFTNHVSFVFFRKKLVSLSK